MVVTWWTVAFCALYPVYLNEPGLHAMWLFADWTRHFVVIHTRIKPLKPLRVTEPLPLSTHVNVQNAMWLREIHLLYKFIYLLLLTQSRHTPTVKLQWNKTITFVIVHQFHWISIFLNCNEDFCVASNPLSPYIIGRKPPVLQLSLSTSHRPFIGMHANLLPLTQQLMVVSFFQQTTCKQKEWVSACARVCVCECVCVWEREWEWECVCVCVCVRERERKI